MFTIVNKCEPYVLLSLNRSVHEWHITHFPDRFKPDTNENLYKYFMNSLANEMFFHFIAMYDTKPIGFIQAELCNQKETTFRYSQKLIYVHIVTVQDEFKRRGIAKMLFDKILEVAQLHNVKRIELDHWDGNNEAVAFTKLGFSAYRHYLVLDI
jgi:GNAT superfamily N-acetyltransferase